MRLPLLERGLEGGQFIATACLLSGTVVFVQTLSRSDQ